MGYPLHRCDVFVSVAGGMRIFEPAADLGILMAIASSFSNRPVDHDTVVIGEVGLGGEVRAVPRIESRLKEAIHMGFQRCILPKRNVKELSADLLKKISVQGIEFVEEATGALIGK
jgi:DNA repair protein RadA/Sms